MSILREIFAHKQQEVSEARRRVSADRLETEAGLITVQNDFKVALQNASRTGLRLVAEVKHKSPSKGVLNIDFNPQTLAETYAENGAAAISVLTDENYFGGSLDILKSIHAMALGLPLLRKDFIFDRYQLLEARAAGASAVLLIVSMLEVSHLTDLISESKTLSLTPLVEVHNETELERALEANAKVIGINNRNLHDFSVKLDTSMQLSKLCPPEIIKVSESGINSIEDIQRLKEAGIDAILVGEALVTAPDIASKVRTMAGMNMV
jgi:indole-3-glycerol phosphate synthase